MTLRDNNQDCNLTIFNGIELLKNYFNNDLNDNLIIALQKKIFEIILALLLSLNPIHDKCCFKIIILIYGLCKVIHLL